MDDAVEQDFFFLNFAEEALVLEKGIAGGLKQLLPFGIGARKIANEEHVFAVDMERSRFELHLASRGVAFDPDGRIRGAFTVRVPESFGINQEILEERGSFGETNRFIAREGAFPEILAPFWIFADGMEGAVAGVFEER